jgi:hypothetical protein
MRRLALLLILSASLFAQNTLSGSGSFSGGLNFGVPGSSGGEPPAASCVQANTSGMSAITGCSTISASGSYYLANNISCPGTAITNAAANVKIYLQGKKITFGTDAANFTQQLTNKTFTASVSNGNQILPRPTGPTTTDATTASIVEMTALSCDLDANGIYETNYTKDVNFFISYDHPHGHRWTNQGFMWSGAPANGTACRATYKVSYPRYGIINSTSNQENRNTGNGTSGGSGLQVDCGEIEAAAGTPLVYSAPIFDDTDNLKVTNTTLTARGWSASAIKNQRNRNYEIAYNTLRVDSGSGEVFNRDQFDGYVIRNGANDTDNGTIAKVHDNTIDDGYHGGIATFQPNTEVYLNTIKTRSRYTNDFAIALEHCGGKAYQNTINNYDAADLTVGGRGVRLDACGGEVYTNAINVYATPFNIEYGGCQAGGVYGIQNENGENGSVHDNVINAYIGPCNGQAFRVTTSGFTANNETYKAIRLPGATAEAWGLAAREGNGLNVIGATTLESDTYIVRDESQTTASAPSNVTYRGTIFKKGANPAAGFHTWSMANYAQLSGTKATHTAIDVQTQNGASLTDVTANALNGYWKEYEIWIKWTRTFTVTGGGNPVSGATVTMTDALGTQYSGLTNASGIAAIELPQVRFYNSASVAVNTETRTPYSLSIVPPSGSGCDTLSASGIAVTGTASDSRVLVCPNTTLLIESGNNTSAAASFTGSGWTNGTLGAGNVSKENVHSLLYSGHTAKVYAHVQAWFGQASHQSVGYDNSTPAQATAMVADMKSRGVDGIFQYWKGSGTFSETAAQQIVAAANSATAFTYATLIDVSAFSCTTQAECAADLIAHIQYLNTAGRFSNASYLKYSGRPVILFFSQPSAGVDWTAVMANSTVSAVNPVWIFQNQSGFTTPSVTGGAYSWITDSFADPDNWGSTYLQAFYTVAKANPSKYAFGSTKKGFNDNEASWGSNRVVNQNCGDTWLQTWNLINANYSTGTQMHGVQLATWDDYEEGTSLETGIDNCVAFTSFSGTGTTLNWAISGAENTLSRFEVFVSTDGSNLMKLADNIAASSRSLNLASYNLSGTLKFYVKAIGKPFFVNKMSAVTTLTL